MRRATPFQRDYQDLHGSFRPVEIVQDQPMTRRGRSLMALALGSVGLFWVLILSVAVLAMLIVGGVFVWSMFTAPPF